MIFPPTRIIDLGVEWSLQCLSLKYLLEYFSAEFPTYGWSNFSLETRGYILSTHGLVSLNPTRPIGISDIEV